MVNEAYTRIAEEIGKKDYLCLFAIYKMDEVTDRWSLLFGYKDSIGSKEKDSLGKVVYDIVAKNLDKEEMQNVARVGIFDSSYHLISESLKYETGTFIQDKKVNGSFVHEGHILLSR